MWWVKALVFLMMVLVVVALFKSLSAMMRGESADGKTVKALTWRIGLSVAIFLFLLVAAFFGWIEPHGVRPA
jgi:putative copper export protein